MEGEDGPGAAILLAFSINSAANVVVDMVIDEIFPLTRCSLSSGIEGRAGWSWLKDRSEIGPRQQIIRKIIIQV